MAHCRRCHRRRSFPSERLARGCLGVPGRLPPGGLRTSSVVTGGHRHRQRVGCLFVPDWNDAVVGVSPAPGSIRLAGIARCKGRQGISRSPVSAGLSCGDSSYGVSLERCHRGRSYARRLRGGQESRNEGVTLLADLRFYRERGKLCAADFQSGQSGGLRKAFAPAIAMAANVPDSFYLFDPCHLCRSSLDLAQQSGF